MMAWARYLMLVVFENFLQFFFRFLPLCVHMSYLKKKKMAVGGGTSQVSHTLKKIIKKKIVVGGEVTQFRL